jgi:MerR family transcriptional regulator, copper efflux regulator
MYIAEFTRATGLPRDTVRFYIKRGLLRPRVNGNRYRSFSTEDVERALLIRNAQALGFSLKEIAAIDAEFTRKGMTLERKIGLMRERLELVDAQIAKLQEMRRYFKRKIAWMENGEVGKEPSYKPAVLIGRNGCAD